ncbi:MAG: transcriptional regulator [Actinophytocola sp.]|uniref:winged helix-turn-helix transcriptional regulator n=1 Tax=Actinophytocola sp. TaxID=1872138 RepID=UPI00132BBEC6|nr:helix-turn-helix domain-containing protein [Actinophytocola sp.]MPZ80794.1 transcriptional regulator [Actinophytocola sp.]
MGTICDVQEPDTRDVYLRNCPCRDVLDLLANKWTALAIGALEEGPRRFGELRRRLEGVSQKMLTQTLRELEKDGLVTRTVYPVVPLRVDYALTELGHSVAEPLAAIRRWSEDNIMLVQRARVDYAARAEAGPIGAAVG